jgi:uncharacterized Fe-S cluster-containing radical SAM superfamily protein
VPVRRLPHGDLLRWDGVMLGSDPALAVEWESEANAISHLHRHGFTANPDGTWNLPAFAAKPTDRQLRALRYLESCGLPGLQTNGD